MDANRRVNPFLFRRRDIGWRLGAVDHDIPVRDGGDKLFLWMAQCTARTPAGVPARNCRADA